MSPLGVFRGCAGAAPIMQYTISAHAEESAKKENWRFPKIRGTILGVLLYKDYSIWGSILGFPYFGKVPNVCTGLGGQL